MQTTIDIIAAVIIALSVAAGITFVIFGVLELVGPIDEAIRFIRDKLTHK